MKLRIGQIIEHKISKRQYVLVRYSYLNLFRNYPKIIVTGDRIGNFIGFESEFKESMENN